MKPIFNALAAFFIVLPLVLLSYQIGAPQTATLAGIGEYLSQPAIKLTSAKASKNGEAEKIIPQRNRDIPEPQLSAAAALAWDFKNDFYLWVNNIAVTRPIASLTKLATAAVVLDYAEPQETVVVSLAAIKNDGASGNLREGEILTVKDLLAAALLESSNDAAYALAEHVGAKLSAHPESGTTPVRAFVRAMNQKFNDLGLLNTNFTDPTGLEDKVSFSTAEDLAKFVRYLRSNPNYALIWNLLGLETYHAQALNGVAAHDFKTTNALLSEYIQVTGGKTGYTARALGNMFILAKSNNGTEIIYLVLGSQNRETDMKNLLDWTGQAWIWPEAK